MKMLLIPVPDEPDPGGGEDTIRSTIEREGFTYHEVELPAVFDLREKLDLPINGATLAIAELSLLGIATPAFSKALAKDRAK